MKKYFYPLLVSFLVVGSFSACDKEEEDPGPNNTATSGTYTDTRDNKAYPWVTIGDQKWMTKNLAYNQSGSKVYNDDPTKEATYGRMYTYDQAKAAVPSGWRLATDDDWKKLEMHYGMTQTEADKLVQRGTDEGKKIGVGLKLEYAGWCFPPSSFMEINQVAYYWTSTEAPNNTAKGIRRSYANFDDHSFRDYEDKGTYFSVRLIKE